MTPALIVTLVLGVVAPISSAYAIVKVAQIRASRSSPAELRAAATDADRVSLESFREFRAWAEERMRLQDERIGVLEGALSAIAAKYTLIKEAFREFYREVRSVLGPQTPDLDSHVRQLLTEQDLDDTFGSELKRLREATPDPPAPV